MKQEESFVRHRPCGDRIVFALALDRKKMKERIMVGKADQIFRGISGNMDAELLCDMVRPLGTFLTDFENDMQGDWNRYGIMPLYDALHVNRWKQPALDSRQVISSGKNMQRLILYGSMWRFVSGMNT